jgi:PAS domain S-box-containing protein
MLEPDGQRARRIYKIQPATNAREFEIRKAHVFIALKYCPESTVPVPIRKFFTQTQSELAVDTDRNLLFGVLALQADLLDADQFIKACTLWTTRKETSVPALLIELGWITPGDKADVERLLERKLKKHGGNPKAGLRDVADHIKRSLAGLQDDDIQRSLAGLPEPGTSTAMETVDSAPRAQGRYRLTRLHASGGIGRVWVAHDSEFGRDVALKELHPERAGQATHKARFLQEARITGQLEHPGIVPVYELAVRPDDRQPFYTMRLVKGRTLNESARAYHQNRVQGQAVALDFVALLNAFVTVCNTVAYAHSRGVIHRDLKGQNVVLGDFGEVVVLDWGLAKLVGRLEDESDFPSLVSDPGGGGKVDLTQQGQTIGTPAYMAPEQAAGCLDSIDRHTDIYGLGAILYEILTGSAPFTGSDIRDVLRKVQEDLPLPPRAFWTEVPPALANICLRALAKNPTDRFTTASELAHEVQGWQDLARRDAEEERDQFFTLSLDLLCIAGFDGYFKRLNPAWEWTLGFTVEELLAEPFSNFVHPDDRERTQSQATRISTGVATVTFENRYRCKDGSYKWLEWTAIGFAARQITYAAARDITARKQAERDLHKSEERYRSAIAAMQDGMVLLDADGGIRACNASAERILGLSAEQMMGRTALDPRWASIHEDGSPFPGETFPVMVTLHTGAPCSNVVMGVQKPSGELTWISINSQALFDTDGTTPAGVVASFTDITDRKRIKERLSEASNELARLRALAR